MTRLHLQCALRFAIELLNADFLALRRRTTAGQREDERKERSGQRFQILHTDNRDGRQLEAVRPPLNSIITRYE